VLWSLLLALGAVDGPAIAAQDISQQLQQLSRDNNFTILGVHKLGATPARQVSGTVKEQIKLLLENYNHILVGDGSGGIERLIILGAKQPLPDQPTTQEPGDDVEQETVLNTTRENFHHLVDAVLVGVNGSETPTRMTVDTGASFVVLSESLGQRLGFKMEELETQEVKTANGPASARISELPTLRLGNLAVGDVEVAFIPDEQLGGSALLGMSALGRFQITLDDKQNRLTLRPKN
jgi:clan AA aspartic protease (TIGR02281 family)